MQVIPAPTKRKIKVGRPYFNKDGELSFFVAHCNECGGKCLATKDDAKYIARRFNQNRKPIKRRVINFLESHGN